MNSARIDDYDPSVDGKEILINDTNGWFLLIDKDCQILDVYHGDSYDVNAEPFLVRMSDGKYHQLFSDGTEVVIGEY